MSVKKTHKINTIRNYSTFIKMLGYIVENGYYYNHIVGWTLWIGTSHIVSFIIFKY